jgi:hypothetical protein
VNLPVGVTGVPVITAVICSASLDLREPAGRGILRGHKSVLVSHISF